MQKVQKTNAARLLDRAGISYTLVPYEVDPDDLSAEHVAALLGEDPACVFKTLALHDFGHGHQVCVVPAGTHVDLKVAAKAAAVKKVEMIPMKQLLPLTGYIRGGCTAIAMKKPLPVMIDASVLTFDKFYVSAGQRGLQLCMAPSDYIRFTGAKVVQGLATTADP